MAALRIQEAASRRVDEICRYTRDRWGTEQADLVVTSLLEAFNNIESRGVMSKPVPAVFGVNGYLFRYQRHFIYCRNLANGDIGSVTILPERMHQVDRFREGFGL